MTVSGVFKSLCHLKQSSTKGADGMDGKKKKNPKVFKEAKVIPLYKSGDNFEPSNYRPI